MKLRAITTGLVTGLLFVGAAWAGTGLAPVATDAPDVTDTGRLLDRAFAGGTGDEALPEVCQGLSGDLICAGAAAVSLEPTPDESAGEYWERDPAECLPLAAQGQNIDAVLEWATHTRSTWIENPNCIYMGGYGLGPSYPIVEWDQEYGLWARSFALVRNGQELILTILDAEGYFGQYGNMCGGTCGAFQLGEDLAAELGIDPNALIVASTHSHTALDLIGGWGAVPEWYMEQVAEAIKDSARQALANARPALLEGGEVLAREFNSERRDTYRSAEDPSLNWLRAYDEQGVIFTIGTYAAHPVSGDEDSGVGFADFPAVFAKHAEERFGGTAGIFQAGLGNMSPRQGPINNGIGLADRIPALGDGVAVSNPELRVARTYWDQPVTNIPLGLLGAGRFFDRPFGGPATVQAGKSAAKQCTSASAVSVNVSVTAAKVGGVVITSAPGEVFANYTNTIEERSPITALAIAQANDALGYMPQSFESDATAQQATGFVGAGVFEYEDAYMIDRCFGDKALETTLGLLGSL